MHGEWPAQNTQLIQKHNTIWICAILRAGYSVHKIFSIFCFNFFLSAANLNKIKQLEMNVNAMLKQFDILFTGQSNLYFSSQNRQPFGYVSSRSGSHRCSMVHYNVPPLSVHSCISITVKPENNVNIAAILVTGRIYHVFQYWLSPWRQLWSRILQALGNWTSRFPLLAQTGSYTSGQNSEHTFRMTSLHKLVSATERKSWKKEAINL